MLQVGLGLGLGLRLLGLGVVLGLVRVWGLKLDHRVRAFKKEFK